MENSKRNFIIDNLRGFSILLVVISHLMYSYPTIYVGNIFVQWFQFIHMPLFFFCSGYLSYNSMSTNPTFKLIKQKFFRLVLPYLSWSSIAFLMNCILVHYQDSLNFMYIKELFINTFFYSESMWFLISLFITMCLIEILIKFKDSKVQLLFILLILCFPFNIKLFSIYKVQELFIVFFLGYLYKKHDCKISFNKSYSFYLMIATLLFLILGYICIFYKIIWPLECILKFVEDFLGVLVFGIIICKTSNNLKTTKILSFFGRYSLEIYCIHMMFIKYLKVPVPIEMFSNRFISILLVFVFSVLISYICIFIAKPTKNFSLINYCLWGSKRRLKNEKHS